MTFVPLTVNFHPEVKKLLLSLAKRKRLSESKMVQEIVLDYLVARKVITPEQCKELFLRSYTPVKVSDKDKLAHHRDLIEKLEKDRLELTNNHSNNHC